MISYLINLFGSSCLHTFTLIVSDIITGAITIVLIIAFTDFVNIKIYLCLRIILKLTSKFINFTKSLE